MIIKKINFQDENKYNELAFQYGSIFHTTLWTNIFGNNVNCFGIFQDNADLIGGFTVYRERKMGFTVFKNLPFTPSIGPFLKVEGQKKVRILDMWKEVLSLVADFLKKLPYALISVSLDSNIIDTQPFIWRKYKVSPGYTYIINLDLSIDELWDNLSKKHRHGINKAIKDGLHVKQINDYTIIKNLCIKTFSRQQKAVSKDLLNKILFEFSTPDNSYAFATFKNNTPIAATFFIYDKYSSYALIGGYDHEDRHHGAGTLSDWAGIKHAKQLGLSSFDFEGSMVPQIERYFRGFGGNLTPYYRINLALLPLEIFLKLIKRDLF